MAYCSKCGQKNPDDSRFCNKCGASLTGPPRDYGKEYENKCDDECSGRRKSKAGTNFWIVILAIAALFLTITILSRIIDTSVFPEWMRNFDYWEIFGLLIGLCIIVYIIYAISQSRRHD
jgi:uncharacterized membrane protein YvbJ